jgi:intein-encoded DNA endonuclease-like protein
VHQDDISFYVKNVDLISLRQKYEYNVKGKTIKTDGRKLLLDALKLIGIGGRNRVPDY